MTNLNIPVGVSDFSQIREMNITMWIKRELICGI